MKLVRARVTNYKSIDDSGWVSMDGVTCLVGKNESGKTAFLQALRRLNPVPGANGEFDLKDYPRKGYARYKRIHRKRPAIVVSAEFELSDQEVDEIGVLASSKIVVHKDYANRLTWNLDFGEPPQGAADRRAVEEHLQTILPRFVYFDDYSSMRGRIAIEDMLERRNGKGELDDADRTFLSLLETAGVELEDLRMQTNYEHLKAELESAAIGISDAMFEYWQQNKQLRVDFDMSLANPDDPPPLNSGTILHVRVWNDRHRVSVSFDERSKGFVWFFSFLTYFSNLEEESLDNLILLLDEPGINLHGHGPDRLPALHRGAPDTQAPGRILHALPLHGGPQAARQGPHGRGPGRRRDRHKRGRSQQRQGDCVPAPGRARLPHGGAPLPRAPRAHGEQPLRPHLPAGAGRRGGLHGGRPLGSEVGP